jgi:response regulator RpfG family c-di-GMP phosphodiesterase
VSFVESAVAEPALTATALPADATGGALAAAPATVPTVPSAEPAEPPWTVLCVDDEPNILSALKRALRGSRYRVLTAPGGAQALEMMESEPADLVISDMRMPGMDGAQLLERMRERWPGSVRILLTGYSDVSATIAAINRGQIYRYINKPWDDAELQVTVSQALERLALEREKVRLEALTQVQNEELRSLNAHLEQRVEERTAEVTKAHEKLKKNYMTSIKVFVNLIELRGGQLVGHGRRVADLTRKLAVAMGCTGDDVQEVFVAALLHDIGLIGLPDEALSKPVPKLLPEELALYRKHTVVGEQALMGLDDLQPMATLIRAHHERFDGQGFPDGKAGQDIPLGARMLAVADIYDDLLSGHLGAPGLSPSDVRTLMMRGRGAQFDPEVLDVFLHMMQSTSSPGSGKPLPPLIVRTDQLMPGMVLAADLISRDKVLLLSTDHVLTDDIIRRIRVHEQREGAPIELRIRRSGRR